MTAQVDPAVPSGGIRRTKRITLYITNGQYARWCEAADAMYMPLPDYIRRWADIGADDGLGKRAPRQT